MGLFVVSRADAAEDEDPEDADVAPPLPRLLAISWQLETGAASTYVFRGRLQYASRRDPSSQSTIGVTSNEVGPGAVSLTGWNATALVHASGQQGTAAEVDLTAAYAWTIGRRFETQVGYTAYFYPRALAAKHADGAHGLFTTVSVKNGFLTPFVGVYPELVRMHGAYATAGVMKTVDILRGFSLTPQASVGGAGCQGYTSHLNDVSAMLVALRTFSDGMYLSCRAAWSFMGGPRSRLPTDAVVTSSRSVPWGMVAMGISR